MADGDVSRRRSKLAATACYDREVPDRSCAMEPLTRRLRQFRDERDWSKFHTPKDLAVSVSIEAGELLELFQWKPDSAPIGDDVRAAVADEAADVLLYLLMLCDRLEIDLEEAAHLKISRNEGRYPIESSYGVARSRRKL